MDKYLALTELRNTHFMRKMPLVTRLTSQTGLAYIKKRTMAQGLKQLYSMPSCCTTCHHSNHLPASLVHKHTKV